MGHRCRVNGGGEPEKGTMTIDVEEELAALAGMTEQTYYRWRRSKAAEVDQAKRLKALEQENARLKKLVAEAELDKAILREAASGNF